MNLVDCVVTEVLAEPYEKYSVWWVLVRYNSWGHESDTTLMAKTKEEADRVKIGHKFLS